MPRRTQNVTSDYVGEDDQEASGTWAQKEDAWAFQRESAESGLLLDDDPESAGLGSPAGTNNVALEAMDMPEREIDLIWNEAFERASVASSAVILAKQRVQEAWQAWSTPEEADLVHQARREVQCATDAESDAWELAWDAFQAIEAEANDAEEALARGEISNADCSHALIALIDAEPKIKPYRERVFAQAIRDADGD